MSMNVPPPEPSSAAATSRRGRGSGVRGARRGGRRRRRADRHAAERRQARRERLRLLIRRPGFIVGVAHPARLDRVRHRWRPITPYRPDHRVRRRACAEHATNWMGTDQLGRDVLSRVMAGARDVLIAAPIAAVISVAAGTLLGLTDGLLPRLGRRGHQPAGHGGPAVDPGDPRGILIVTSLGSSKRSCHRHGRRAVHADRRPHRAPPCSPRRSWTTSRRPGCAASPGCS